MESLVPAPRAVDRALRRAGSLRSLRFDQAAPLVGGAGGDHRRRGARAAAEHRPGRGMRHDERTLASGLSRAPCGRVGGACDLGAQRAADHRAYAAHVVLARPSDNMAPLPADTGAGLDGALEMAGRAAHENGVAPADGDSTIACRLWSSVLPAMRYHPQMPLQPGTRG